jgi:hypothetical protein
MQHVLTGRKRTVEPDSEVRKRENSEIRTSEGGLKHDSETCFKVSAFGDTNSIMKIVDVTFLVLSCRWESFL